MNKENIFKIIESKQPLYIEYQPGLGFINSLKDIAEANGFKFYEFKTEQINDKLELNGYLNEINQSEGKVLINFSRINDSRINVRNSAIKTMFERTYEMPEYIEHIGFKDKEFNIRKDVYFLSTGHEYLNVDSAILNKITLFNYDSVQKIFILLSTKTRE